jgi:hypothetical protein
MIVVQVIGGLGNQMFQYALGRHLAIKTREELVLDLTGFEQYALHAYSLNHLNIAGRAATKEEVASFVKLKPKKGRRHFLYNFFVANPHRYALEKYYHFDPSILSRKGSMYLEGYWQSEKYFKDIEESIRKDFSLVSPLSKRDEEILSQMQNTNATSLHVRRKDFAHHPELSAFHGVCSPEYYDKAVATIAKRSGSAPHLFIFSDDPAWAKENLHFPYPMTHVDHNDASKNYADIYLMSQCKHNIIANSSFSWWGAWLNSNPYKIVIAPSRWTNDPGLDTKDLIPPTWIRI